MDQSPIITPGVAWRKPREEGYTITLPSGNVCKLRPVALDVMLANGKLPDLLSGIAAKALWTETDMDTIGGQGEMAKNFADLVNVVTLAAMLEPVIVEVAAADNEITLADIEFADKVAIFQLATGGSTMLQKFRERQAADVESAQRREDVQPAA